MVSAVGDAVGGVMDFAASFFPHSPAERGIFSGTGWNAVEGAGLAIGDQLAAGLIGSEGVVGAAANAMLRTSADGSPSRQRPL